MSCFVALTSGGRVGRPAIRSALVRIPDSPRLHVEASSRQLLDPWIAPDERSAPCAATSAISVWKCVWVGECDKCCKALWAVSRLEKRYRNANPFHLPFDCWLHTGLELRSQTWKSSVWPSQAKKQPLELYDPLYYQTRGAPLEMTLQGNLLLEPQFKALPNGLYFSYIESDECLAWVLVWWS